MEYPKINKVIKKCYASIAEDDFLEQILVFFCERDVIIGRPPGCRKLILFIISLGLLLLSLGAGCLGRIEAPATSRKKTASERKYGS